jgi:hypothetical protein
MEADYKPTGWLGALMGTRLYFNMADARQVRSHACMLSRAVPCASKVHWRGWGAPQMIAQPSVIKEPQLRALPCRRAREPGLPSSDVACDAIRRGVCVWRVCVARSADPGQDGRADQGAGPCRAGRRGARGGRAVQAGHRSGGHGHGPRGQLEQHRGARSRFALLGGPSGTPAAVGFSGQTCAVWVFCRPALRCDEAGAPRGGPAPA